MLGLKVLRSTQIIVLGICFAVATIVSAGILSKAFLMFKRISTEVIDVTGSASKEIRSDYAVWECSFSRKDEKMVDAFRKLKEDLAVVREYLKSKGIKDEEIVVPQVRTRKLYKYNSMGQETNEIEAYIMTQKLEVQTYDVDMATSISRESTELLEKGVEFISSSPDYFYTKLNELKHEMLSLASEDAKKRAERMAKAAGNKIGVMRNARMGVFQITSANSFEVSGYGYCDTSSLEKKITAVAHVEFAISTTD